MSQTRTSRVSITQLLHLWEFLNSHKEIAVGYNKSTQARAHNRRMWERITEILNSAGEGAVKSASEWSKYWVDMKAKLKKKNRLINESRRRTGGGPAINLELSEIDRKFLSILGEDLVSGLPGVRVELPPALQENNIAGPSDMDTSQSTATEEAVYLLIPSSDEYQHSEPNQVLAIQHSASPTNPQTSPSRQGTTGQGARSLEYQHSEPNQVLAIQQTPTNTQTSPSRQGTTVQVARRSPVLPAEAEPLSRQATAEQGPARRRRRQRQQLSAADARERLVIASERRAQAELANSHSIGRAADLLGEIVTVLRNIQAGLSDAVARDAQRDPAL